VCVCLDVDFVILFTGFVLAFGTVSDGMVFLYFIVLCIFFSDNKGKKIERSHFS
jgi:uncharacterized RDD family membrane protein YckC